MKGSKWNCSEATCQKCIADDSGPSLNSLIASCNGAEGRSQLIRVVGLLRDKEPSPSSFQHILPAGKQLSNVESSGRLLLHTNVELGMTMQFNPSHKVTTGSYLCRYWCQYLTFVWLSPCRKLISTHQVLTQTIRAAFWHTPHPPCAALAGRRGAGWERSYVHLSSKWWQWEGRRLIVSINSCSCRLLPVNLSAR